MPRFIKILFVAFAAMGAVSIAMSLLGEGDGLATSDQDVQSERTAGPTEAPSEVAFEIIGDDTFGASRRSVDVRLQERVSETVLATIAESIRDDAGQDFARTFIVYYLPGMEVDAGGWATTHFNPELEITVLGSPAGTVITDGTCLTDDMVGRWITPDHPLSVAEYRLYQRDDNLMLETVYRDGSGTGNFDEMTMAGDELRYVTKGGSLYNGVDFLMLSDRAIELWDDEGKWITAADGAVCWRL